MRQVVRSLARSPGFCALVIAVLSIGLGANAALFSIVDRVLLHPFRYPQPDRLVDISGLTAKGQPAGISPAEFKFWQTRIPAFEQSVIWHWRDLALTGVENPESLWDLEVSSRAFDILGIPPLRGRLFSPGDFRGDSPPVAIVSYRFWRYHFNGDPSLVGRQILLDGDGYTVVGIMGPGFFFTNPEYQIWTPLNPFHAIKEDLKHGYGAIAQLRPGASLEQAQREMDAIAPAMPRDPKEPPGWHALLRPYAAAYTAAARPALYTLWSAVLFVMLIACANAANLLLSRASYRRREFAVRASLGAGWLRLAGQLLAESALLGIAAGAVGIVIAWALLRVFLALSFLAPDRAALTPASLFFTLAAVLATTILCVLPSCWDLWRSNLNFALHASSRNAGSDRVSNRARAALVALEAALAVMLLIGAGVMLKSLIRILDAPLGFNPDGVLTARVSAPPALKSIPQLNSYFDRLLEQVNAIPGVRSSGIVTVLPMSNLVATTTFNAEGSARSPDSTYSVRLRSVSPDYFHAMGVRILRGRGFSGRDTTTSLPVAIINDELARHFWPGQDPIGKHVSRNKNPKPGDWFTVAGVVESSRDLSSAWRPGAELYRPFAQDTTAARATSLVVRTGGDPLSIAQTVARRIHAIAPDQPVTEVKTMRDWVGEATTEPRFHTTLLEIFAAFALLLAISGVFASVSYSVTQRRHDIGVRGALGATAHDIRSFVLRLGMRPVIAGMTFGVAAAMAGAGALKSQLYGTAPLDPTVFAVVVPLLLIAAAAATLVPARRAVRIDPAVILRSE